MFTLVLFSLRSHHMAPLVPSIVFFCFDTSFWWCSQRSFKIGVAYPFSNLRLTAFRDIALFSISCANLTLVEPLSDWSFSERTTQPAKPKLLENFPVCQSERACLLSLDFGRHNADRVAYERKMGEGETDILRVTHTHASACVFRWTETTHLSRSPMIFLLSHSSGC